MIRPHRLSADCSQQLLDAGFAKRRKVRRRRRLRPGAARLIAGSRAGGHRPTRLPPSVGFCLTSTCAKKLSCYHIGIADRFCRQHRFVNRHDSPRRPGAAWMATASGRRFTPRPPLQLRGRGPTPVNGVHAGASLAGNVSRPVSSTMSSVSGRSAAAGWLSHSAAVRARSGFEDSLQLPGPASFGDDMLLSPNQAGSASILGNRVKKRAFFNAPQPETDAHRGDRRDRGTFPSGPIRLKLDAVPFPRPLSP